MHAHRLIAAASLALAACGTTPGAPLEPSDADTGSADTGSADTTPAVDTTPTIDTAPTPDVDEPDTGPLPPTCVDGCAARPSEAGDLCAIQEDCVSWCVAAIDSADPETYWALEQCLAVEPLCFETPLQCVMRTAFPEPIWHEVTLAGSGFGRYEGERIVVGMETPGETVVAEAIIRDAAFEVTLEVFTAIGGPHTLLYFVDADRDGRCRGDGDVTGSASDDLWRRPIHDLSLPDWRIEVTHDPERDSAWVCDYLE